MTTAKKANEEKVAREVSDPCETNQVAAGPAASAVPRVVELSVPVAELNDSYATVRIDVRLTPDQANGLQRLYLGCRGAPMACGVRLVDTPARAIQKLLEMIEDAAGD